MKTRARLRLSTMFILVSIMSIVLALSSVLLRSDITSSEYEVFSCVLSDLARSDGEPILIPEFTLDVNGPLIFLPQKSKLMAIPQLDKAMIADYLRKNNRRHAMKDRFANGISVVLTKSDNGVGDTRVAEMFKDGRLSAPPTVMWMSRPGFNAKGDRAFLLVRYEYGGRRAAHLLITLERNKGDWIQTAVIDARASE